METNFQKVVSEGQFEEKEVELLSVPVGSILAVPVYSPLGALLLERGRTIGQREKEMLKAFKINKIRIQIDKKIQVKTANKQVDTSTQPATVQPQAITSSEQIQRMKEEWKKEYEESVKLIEKVMIHVQTGGKVPVLEIRKNLENMLQQVSTSPSLMMSIETVRNVDLYTYHHSTAVAILAPMLAKWSGLPENEQMQIALAGMLLDIGKSKIDSTILQKPGALTQAEYEEMKQHTVLGYQILKDTPGLSSGVALAALQHHEREDGTGYPLGLTGDKIHPYGKIIAICDIYHAMVSNRVYRKGSSPFLVFDQLLNDAFGRLDPNLVHIFVRNMMDLSVGEVVKLNNGEIGKIIFITSYAPTRPMIEVNGNIIDLNLHRDLHILEII
ncbi:HD-GYP domain-containing protein [Rubeoparvulum massiliense]|uniref:HD-GYP domain-containing protein n=1 Tax=Rubeoparvulum massiliense TaxID=1631346 RepID=UPI00065E7E54|nr:HD-GYP domain-containing protein [Rubeoparvulum massiliense]